MTLYNVHRFIILLNYIVISWHTKYNVKYTHISHRGYSTYDLCEWQNLSWN